MFLLFFIVDVTQQQHDFFAFDCRYPGTVIGIIVQFFVFIPNTHLTFGIGLSAVKFGIKDAWQKRFITVQQLLVELGIEIKVTATFLQREYLFRIMDTVITLMLHIDADCQCIHMRNCHFGSFFTEWMFDFLGQVFKGQYRIRISVRVAWCRNDLDTEPKSLLIFKNMLNSVIIVGKLVNDVGAVGNF